MLPKEKTVCSAPAVDMVSGFYIASELSRSSSMHECA